MIRIPNIRPIALILITAILFQLPVHGLQFIFETDAGVNILAEDKKKVEARYGLEKLSSQVAISYDIKVGLQFLEHYAIFLAYGYSKRPDYYYPIDIDANNSSFQESQKNYSIGIDSTYYFWNYSNRFNVALSLGNRALMKAVRVTKLEYHSGTENISAFIAPTSSLTYHYLLAPELKLFYRLVENSTIYFGFQYNLVFPNFEQYPVFLLGIDIHFSTN